jgi:hypothetical protein
MLDKFISQCLHSAERRPNVAPTPSLDELIVEKVAPVSIAAAAGVRVGDRFLSVDGVPAGKVEFSKFTRPDHRYHYEFYRPSSSERLTLDTCGAPIGVHATATTEGLEARVLRGKGDYEDLDTLWERGQWEALARCSHKLRRPSGVIGLVLSWVMSERVRGVPSLLMEGAALYELGKRAEAMSLVHEYRDKHERNWTRQYEAIARYYIAKDAIARGDRKSALALLEQAFQARAYDRIADAIQEISGRLPSAQDPWEGKPFPLAYELPEEKTGRVVDWAGQLRQMAPHQVFVICWLGPYRANGPYHEFMRHFRRLAVYFSNFLVGMHVITENLGQDASKREFTEQWIRGEKEARAAGAPFVVLQDAVGRLGAVLMPTGSPTLLVVDSRSTIVQKGGLLEDVDFWNVLAKVDKQP